MRDKVNNRIAKSSAAEEMAALRTPRVPKPPPIRACFDTTGRKRTQRAPMVINLLLLGGGLVIRHCFQKTGKLKGAFIAIAA